MEGGYPSSLLFISASLEIDCLPFCLSYSPGRVGNHSLGRTQSKSMNWMEEGRSLATGMGCTLRFPSESIHFPAEPRQIHSLFLHLLQL